MTEQQRIYLYDTTLRDGAQTQGVDFSVADKIIIAEALDRLGFDYIEGGWPGANPTDDDFFEAPPKFHQAAFTAFGMTKRAGRSAENDPALAALVQSKASVACLVGKSWDHQVELALGIKKTENFDLISESLSCMVRTKGEAHFDAEHFFDGFKQNPEYALECCHVALKAGARWITLCDTNGGTLPHEVFDIVTQVANVIPGQNLGIHAHNDTENAVANSIAAVQAGARLVQGTINGLGERCGNANLISLIPTLQLKMGYKTAIPTEKLKELGALSRLLDDRLNQASNPRQPYVGASAFAHKGGLHVSAVAKDPACYEHIDPILVGNNRHIVVSDQAGRSNILARFQELGIELDPKDPAVSSLVDKVKQREYQGYAYDSAAASFELMARRHLHSIKPYFDLSAFRVLIERRFNANGSLVTQSEVTTRLSIDEQEFHTVSEGNGPVDALDKALRKALQRVYPILSDIHLMDYKVRILTPKEGTEAITRVLIESADNQGHHWTTIGVSPNVIDASFNALADSYSYFLYRNSQRPKK